MANIQSSILSAQRNEITEYHIYSKLSQKDKDLKHKKILKRISQDELKHYAHWKSITKKDVSPNKIKIFFYSLLAAIFGLSFTLKFMEKNETSAVKFYKKLESKFKISLIKKDEQRHEAQLLDLIEEEKIAYASSIVLGLNDALVELTGALAGLTLALQNTKIIAMTVFITGIAASMSMSASAYFSSKEEASKQKTPKKSALYTGITYIITVVLLVIPYLIFNNVYLALALALLLGFSLMFTYTFFITTAKNLKFWRRFLEMALISLTVSIITFAVGYLLRITFNI